MGYIRTAGFLFTIWALAAVLGGCSDPHAEDKAEIRAALVQLDQANEASDGEAAVAVMTSRALDHYTQIVQLALDGSEQQVRALGPTDLGLVIALRNRMTRGELEGMDGRAYQAHATSEGWYAGRGSDWAGFVGSIRVRDDIAYGVILDVDGRDSGHEAVFRREDGAWKINEFSFHAAIDEGWREQAAFEGMTVEDLIIWWEEDDWGNPIGDEIWEPMR